jgi:hypothetical protein
MGLLRYALLAAAAGLLVLGGTGCDNTGKQDTSNQGTSAASSADTGADDSAAVDAAEGGADAQDAGPATAIDADAGGDAAAEDAADDEEPVRYYREVNCDITFLKAEFNPDPDATMSILRFLFEARVARGVTIDQEVELKSINEAPSAELDLNHSRLEFMPFVENPRLTDEGPLGEYNFRFEGMYRINLYMPDGTLCGVFAINGQGDRMSAPPDERPAGFNATSRVTRNQYGPRKYQVYRDVEKGETAEILYTVYYRPAGFQTLEVVSPDQDIYEYRFPEGRLTVRKGDEKDDERPRPRNPEEDYEDR